MYDTLEEIQQLLLHHVHKGIESKRISYNDLLDIPAASGGAIVTATFVVAASDAKVTTRADYVCDGTDDDVQIQAAIDALPSGVYGRVHLTEGHFTIGTAISVPSYVSITGCGPATVLKVKNSAGSFYIFKNSDWTNGNEEIVIRDLAFDGNKANNNSGAQEAVYFYKVGYNTGHTFNSTHKKGCLIQNCFIKDFRYLANTGALHLNKINNSIIANNIIVGSSYGIKLYGASGDESISNMIIGNFLRGNYIGIGLDIYADLTTISNNQCIANNLYGIKLYGGDDNIISNNIIGNNTTDGIHLATSHDNIVSHNKIFKNGANGIYLTGSDRNSIQLNMIRALGGQVDGIEIANSACDDNLVTNNDLKNAGTANDLLDNGTGTITVAGNRT